RPYRLRIGDFNGDGRGDVAELGFGPRSVTDPGTITLYYQDGSGALRAATAVPLGYSGAGGPTDVQAADVNGDGRTDLLVISRGLRALLQTAAGTFAAA